MARIKLVQRDADFLRNVLSTFSLRYKQQFVEPIMRVLSSFGPGNPIWQPTALAESLAPLVTHPLATIPDHWVPFLKRVIIDSRRDCTKQIEWRRERSSNSHLYAEWDKELAAFDVFFQADWFIKAEAFRLPRITDFLTLERAEEVEANKVQLSKRVYDEKFHILQAPTLFLEDLGYYREKCSMRDVPVSVCFMDIDNFKSYNSSRGETYIDLHLLPKFMAALEAHVFHRGDAYRYGGDEYAVLLPNSTLDYTGRVLREFQVKLRDLKYEGIEERTTVSIGFCEADPDCHLTDRELLGRAERAKNYAKKKGKDRVATYNGPLFREEDLYVVGDESSGAR